MSHCDLRSLLAASLVLSAAISAGCGSGGASGGNSGQVVTSRGELADTTANIHLFQVFDFGIPDVTAAAPRYDFVWGAGSTSAFPASDPVHFRPPNETLPALQHDVSLWRAGNPRVFLSRYLRYSREMGIPGGPDVGDKAYWQATHPDWLVYRNDRTTFAKEFDVDPNLPLDISNPDVIDWQIRTYVEPTVHAGYDALAVDNLAIQNVSGRAGIFHNGQWVQLYSGDMDDGRWRADLINWLSRIHQYLHSQLHPLALVANLFPPSDYDVPGVAQNLDGLLDEIGFTLGGGGYLTDERWLATIHLMQEVQADNKPYFSINEIPAAIGSSPSEIEWIVASYLLAKERSAYLFITGIQDYGFEHLYPAYMVQVGAASGPMLFRQNSYQREYEHGLVIVNPSATNATRVDLPSVHTYTRVDGTPVSGSLDVPAQSGLLLVTQG